jgi:diadenosine tetraphosphate (Ap4A) HIT family hydrolase
MANELHPRNARLMTRVREAEAANGGHLPMPDVAGWDIFPFEGDVRVTPLKDPVLPEPHRGGEGDNPCQSCGRGTEGAIWTDGTWTLIGLSEPASIPIVLLLPVDHYDHEELPEELARDMGWLQVRLSHAMHALGGVGRVHVWKVGDGGRHLHWWFFARPEGVLQLRGSSLSDWSDCIPPMPQDEWDDVMRQIAAELAKSGGEALV